MLNKINETNDTDIRNTLLRLFSLYGLYTIDREFMGVLYRGGFLEGSKPTELIQEAILKLIKELKDDAITLVDVIAPDDFLMNSVLGKSDGQVRYSFEIYVIFFLNCF